MHAVQCSGGVAVQWRPFLSCTVMASSLALRPRGRARNAMRATRAGAPFTLFLALVFSTEAGLHVYSTPRGLRENVSARFWPCYFDLKRAAQPAKSKKLFVVSRKKSVVFCSDT